MKRKHEMVPEFDEIIFENRNKTYGAYDLRKRYKSAASISILGAMAFSVILFTALSFIPENREVFRSLSGLHFLCFLILKTTD